MTFHTVAVILLTSFGILLFNQHHVFLCYYIVFIFISISFFLNWVLLLQVTQAIKSINSIRFIIKINNQIPAHFSLPGLFIIFLAISFSFYSYFHKYLYLFISIPVDFSTWIIIDCLTTKNKKYWIPVEYWWECKLTQQLWTAVWKFLKN